MRLTLGGWTLTPVETGYLWLDGGSMMIALVAILPVWPVWGTRVWLDMLLVFAGLYQLAGWLAATRLIGRR